MGLLELRDVGKSFASGDASFFAVRHVNLSFPRKGLFAIKGKSGSGKSTLLNLMAKLLYPSEGKIFFKGKDLTAIKGKRLAYFHLHEVTTVFQHYNLIEGATALSNVTLPLLLAKVPMNQAKKKAGALFAEFHLSSLENKNVDSLSGGEKQRVAIMRALSNDPAVILADEPTGALDEKSSEAVMGMLQLIAKSRLVIFVSHNEELIGRYAETVITVKDGQVSPFLCKEVSSSSREPTHFSYGRKWTSFFTGRNFKRNAKKNAVAFLAGTIGFASLLLALGFYQGSTESLANEESHSLEYQSAKISERTYVEIPNSPLKLVKQTRPDQVTALDATAPIDSVSIEKDYSYFFPSYNAYSFEGENADPCSFLPVYDLTLTEGGSELLSKGELPLSNSLDEVLVNEEFARLYSGGVLNKRIDLASSYSFSYGGEKEEGALSFHFEIVGVVHEFSFLNAPKVYYSYSALAGAFAKKELPRLTKALQKETTIDSLLDLIPSDSPITGYDYLLFIHKPKEVPLLDQLIASLLASGSFLSIDSSTYAVKAAFKELTDAFNVSLLVFVGIALVGVSLIIALTSYSNFVARKKETAVLFTLGARSQDLESVYINESVSVALLAAVVALAISPLLQKGINALITKRFGLENLIQIPLLSYLGYRFTVPVLLILFAMLLAYLASSLPLASLKRMPLAEELQDE